MNTHDHRIDRLRLLACFGVVMLHSSHGSGAGDLALNAMFRFSVPVFVIISGYFQFPAPSFSGICKKIGTLLVKMVLCSGIYLLYSLFKGNPPPAQPLIYLLSEPVHLWYLYAAMGLYLLTPALAPFVRSADEKEYRYALAVCFVLGSVIVTLVRLDWIPLLAVILDKSKLPDMLGFTGLYLLGGYFRKFGVGERRSWLLLWGISTAVSAAVSNSTLAGQLLGFLSPNVVLSGCACFAAMMTLPDAPERFRPILRAASACTMGVYLYHTLICDLITPMIGVPRDILGGLPAMAVRGICTFAASFAAVWLLRRIPLLKKWML